MQTGRALLYRERMRTGTLTRDQVVKAAIDLLDAEGLEGLNMRALGKRLGSAPTAVYWHVGSKSNLITLAGDHVWNEIGLSDLTAIDWRTAASSLATDLRAMITRHPWLVQVLGAYFVYGPGKARHDDYSLALYEAAGFADAQADQAATTVFTYVLGNALGPAAATALKRKLNRRGGNAKKLMGDRVAQARKIAAAFPRLRERLKTASADYGASPENSFEFGLQAVLDGLAGRLTTGPTPAGKKARKSASQDGDSRATRPRSAHSG